MLREEYGDVYKIKMFNKTFLHIHNPEDAETLMRNESSMPIKPSFECIEYIRRNDFKEYYKESVGLFCQGEEWYRFRQMVQQDLMRPRSALVYIKNIEEIALQFNRVLASNRDHCGKANIGGLTQQYALEAVYSIFMGKNIGALQQSERSRMLLENVEVIVVNLLLLSFIPPHLARWLPFYRKIVVAFNKVTKPLSETIKESIENINIDDESNETVLAKLVRKCGKGSQIPLIMAMDAILAGIDTTGHTASVLLYHLAMNPKQQELLYQEVVTHMGEEGEVTEKALASMKYLKACQVESQRILPIGGMLGRITEVDLVLGGYHIPAGTTVMRMPHVLQNCETQFPCPDLFQPERWLRGHEACNTAHSFSNLPFGHGARSCVGQRFARLELQVLLAKVVQRYKMEYRGEEVDLKTGFVNYPDREVVIHFKERRG